MPRKGQGAVARKLEVGGQETSGGIWGQTNFEIQHVYRESVSGAI